MKHGILLLLIFPISFCSEAIGKEDMTSSPEAIALMKQVVAEYQSLSSYRDRGRTIQTLKSSSSDQATLVIDFTTVSKDQANSDFLGREQKTSAMGHTQAKH